MYLVELGSLMAPVVGTAKPEGAPETDTPDRRREQLNAIIGPRVVPTYQWFMAGSYSELTDEDMLELERLFFAGQDHGDGDIELSQHPDGYHVLRIRHARVRRLEIKIADECWPLNAAMHLEGGSKRIISFTKGASFVC